jgi:hypothetical protein
MVKKYICTYCGELKPLEEFRKHGKSTKSGYSSYCKKCVNDINRQEQNKKKIYSLKSLHTALFITKDQNRYLKNHGCTVKKLKKHIESQFKGGMTWDNYGEWQLDHIMPHNSFNLKDRNELLKCMHYTNIQPLWRSENASKGAKIPEMSTV